MSDQVAQEQVRHASLAHASFRHIPHTQLACELALAELSGAGLFAEQNKTKDQSETKGILGNKECMLEEARPSL
jgi:hypothetical protein